ncbi:MAG: YqgE/AlgH family protein [Actinomycetota bacterium]
MLPGRSTRNRLLVATPPLEDPNFDRTVVFMIEHNVEGAVGVVLNRPDPTFDLDDLVDADVTGITDDCFQLWQPFIAEPAQVFLGGPVGLESMIALAAGSPTAAADWQVIGSMFGTVDLSRAPHHAAPGVQYVRIFRGYSGWAPGQLEAEISAGGWMVFDSEHDDVYTNAPDQLWRTVVRRQGGNLAWVADAPDDLSAN